METVVFTFLCILLAFFLGSARGEIHERNRIERAEKKVANRTFNIRDIGERRR